MNSIWPTILIGYIVLRQLYFAIRILRNEAAHGRQRFMLSDALDVRGILFTRGLIADMAFLLERAASAGLAPK